MDIEHVRLGNQIDRLLRDKAVTRGIIEKYIKDYELKGYEATTFRLKKLLREIEEHTS